MLLNACKEPLFEVNFDYPFVLAVKLNFEIPKSVYTLTPSPFALENVLF